MNKYHKIYDDFPCIIDEIFNLIYIPLMNKYNKVSGYAISNLALKDKLLDFRYNQRIRLTKVEKRYAISNLGISMHEIVIGKKADEGYVIDHINGDGLLNTEENLRYATSGLNAQNKAKQSNTSSQYIGVSWHKKDNKWRTAMRFKGEPLDFGSFNDEIEAAKVYDMYVLHYYKGESPNTNNLLTKNEIKDIRCNGIPEKYQKKIRDLPKNIYFKENNSYNVRVTYGGEKYDKTVKTLEAAILLKTQIMGEIEGSKAVAKYGKPITRNINGLAIIYASNMECIVDDDHWYDLNQYKWYCYKNESDKIYAYPSAYVNGKQEKLHIYIYKKYIGEIPSNMSVDHVISKNILDVRVQNLRLADRSLQNHNRDMSQNRIDKYKGIQFTTSGYEVKVNHKYYGTYQTAEEAAEKANDIYIKIYGNNATLNVIDNSKQTTKYNRIPDEYITKEYIMSLTKVIDVQNIVMTKDLNTKKGGKKLNDKKIKVRDIRLSNLDEYKQIVIGILYPSMY